MKCRCPLIGALCAMMLLLMTLAGLAQTSAPGVIDDAIPRENVAPDTADVPPAFRIVGLDDRPKLRENLRLQALRARRIIFRSTDLDWEGTALIVWTDDRHFRDRTGFYPEHVAAAAAAERRTIWINEAAWLRATPEDQQRTLTHECGHLLLGTLPGGRELPLWANEGIVMHLAGQWSIDDQLKLLAAHAAGRLPRLENLEREFPREAEAQTLAYRMSFTAVDVVAQNYGDEPGQVRRLVQRLAEKGNGEALRNEFWDAFRREGWQLSTERALGSRVTSGVIILTGSGTIFLLITFFVIFAGLKVKKRNEARKKQEVEEEPWAASLTDEDVQDIYGDREDRWKEDKGGE